MPRLSVVNPSTGKVAASLPADDARSVAAKYGRAREGQPRWARTRLKERLATLARFRELVAKDAERLAHVLTMEVGKPIAQSRNELKGVLPRIDFFLEETAHALRARRVSGSRGGTPAA